MKKKNLRRFHIDNANIIQTRAAIRGGEANHIKNVLRMGKGEGLLLFDDQGNEYEAVIEAVTPQGVELEIIETVPFIPREKGFELHVAQSFLKDKKMDLLIRQITELGVAVWHPFFSERSIPQPGRDRVGHRMERWEKIAREAQKQCLRNHPIIIEPPVAFQGIIDQGSHADVRVIFWEEEAMAIGDTLKAQDRAPEKVFMIIGPEGGFSSQEIALAKEKGFVSLSLGPRLLKAETAAIAACALMQFLFGDMK
jgi:16S rRNA (uracil1498-N3)-methyltransferase